MNFQFTQPLHHNYIFLVTIQCNATLGRCKIGKYMFPSRFGNTLLTHQTFVTNLHISRVELHCRLQQKLHRVTEPRDKQG